MKTNVRLLILTAFVLACMNGAVAQGLQGQALVDSLKNVFAHAPADSASVRLLMKIAVVYYNTDPAKGIPYVTQAIAISKKTGWQNGLGESYNKLGNIYISQSAFDTATYYYQQALTINTAIGNRQGSAQNLGNLGNIAYMQSDFPRALDYLFRALRIFEDIGDKQGIVTQLSNIGNIYQQQKNYAAALKYDTLAMKKYIEIGDRDGQAILLGNMGNVYADMGQPAKAIESYKAAISLCKALNDQSSVARNLANLGDLYKKLGNFPKTFECLKESERIYTALGDDNGLAVAYVNLGDFFDTCSTETLHIPPIAGVPADKHQCLMMGINYLQKALVLHRRVGNLSSLVIEYQLLSAAYAMNEDYKAALDAFTQYKRFDDSVFQGDNNVKIARLETDREVQLRNKQIEIDRLAVEKKRNERGFFIVGIGLLMAVIGVVFRNYRVQKGLNGLLSIEKKKVEEHTEELDITNKELSTTLANLKETQQQLIVVEKQKENAMIRSRISQDIHDDISSELTRISWVSELAKAKVKKADYSTMPDLLEKITGSSRETVTKLGEIIWTVNPANDSLASLLAYMRAHITKFFADTAFSYSVHFPEAGTDVPINPELKRNLYLVMKEALNNVVKYSGAKEVIISLTLDNNAYRFCIADNGKGIEPGVVQGGGNGLGNMRRRMESVQGTCTITSAPGKGTEICCTGILH